MDISDTIQNLLSHKGGSLYGGEAITQTEHALQCAAIAEAEGSDPELITAALLHDIGHFLEPDFEVSSAGDDDLEHERLGEKFLIDWFGPAVTEPVLLHVAAKRYLCAVEDHYFDGLSPASVRSLEKQGGPMSDEEIHAFESNPHFQSAVRLRRWDDMAKVPDAITPGIDHFIGFVRQSVNPGT